jgi:hypothetical protein
MRVLVAILSLGCTFAAVVASLWYGYFSLYWLAGEVFGPSLGLGLIAAPVSALMAFGLAMLALVVGMRFATRLDDRFAKNDES